MKVSVVIAAYNHEKCVAAVIGSVLAQTFDDFEIILIDDASTDRTFESAQAVRDPRLQCLRAPQHRGVSATYNAGIERACGEYIAVLDCDGMFHPQKLARQAVLLDRQPEIGAVFSHVEPIDDAGLPYGDAPPAWQVLNQINRSRHAWLRQFFFAGSGLCHPSAMVRKAAYGQIGLYDIRYAQIYDLDLWIRLCLRHEIHVIEEPLTGFRVRDNQATANHHWPETATRVEWEYEHVVRRYLGLLDYADFNQVFPESTLREDEWDSDAQCYALAKLALSGPRPAHQRLALELLHELFGRLGAARTEQRFGLPLNWFLQTTGAVPLVRFGARA